jgi:signal transduction histidine kinase
MAQPDNRQAAERQEIDETERLSSLGTLVAGVAHEINNPITYVLGNLGELERLSAAMREAILTYRARTSELLGESAIEVIGSAELKVHEAGGIEALDELFVDTLDGATRIRDLVRDLLTLSRPSEGSTTPVNVNDILDSALRLLSRQLVKRARLERDYQATRLIAGDRAKLGQVFLNLITNAVHACSPDLEREHVIAVRTADTDTGVFVEIEDTGSGIPEESKAVLFEPFFTTKGSGEGTGLGLSISRQIVQRHSGQIDFRDRSGGGTIFRVSLPERG